jgi:hypothetical protein
MARLLQRRNSLCLGSVSVRKMAVVKSSHFEWSNRLNFFFCLGVTVLYDTNGHVFLEDFQCSWDTNNRQDDWESLPAKISSGSRYADASSGLYHQSWWQIPRARNVLAFHHTSSFLGVSQMFPKWAKCPAVSQFPSFLSLCTLTWNG